MQEDRGEKMVGIVLNDNAYEQDIRELLMRAVYDTEKGMGTYGADIQACGSAWRGS